MSRPPAFVHMIRKIGKDDFMYFLFGIFFIICLFFLITGCWRRHRIICRVRKMAFCDKICLLNDIIAPFGFFYHPTQDVIVSTVDAWQREFGYCAAYDKTAPYFNMVFDCEPVYFDYNGRTWLIEFWKGQYGINTGAEIGIYHADSVLAPEEYSRTLFQSASDREMLNLSSELTRLGRRLYCLNGTHWWLSGFRMGYYSNPDELSLRLSLTFPDACMLQSFTESLRRRGYNDCSLCVCGLTANITFHAPSRGRRRTLRAAVSQWKNRLFCRLFCHVTRPFTQTYDKLLYLYFYLPPAFRHMLSFKRNRKQKRRRRR